MSATGYRLACPNSISLTPIREIDNQIIQNVRLRPSLYKSLYKSDLKSRAADWNSVAQAVGLSPEDCQRRWRVLRDRYCREKRANSVVTPHKQAVSVQYKFKRRWPYYDLMSFLGAYVRHKKSEDNAHFLEDAIDFASEKECQSQEVPNYSDVPEDYSMSNGDEEDFIQPTNYSSSHKQKNAKVKTTAPVADKDNQNEDCLETGMNDTSSELTKRFVPLTTHALNSSSQSHKGPKPVSDDVSFPNKRSRNSIDTQLVRIIRSTQSTIMDLLSRRPNLDSENDEDELFGRTVVASLKKLPHNKKLEAKARFFQLLTELQHMDDGCKEKT